MELNEHELSEGTSLPDYELGKEIVLLECEMTAGQRGCGLLMSTAFVWFIAAMVYSSVFLDIQAAIIFLVTSIVGAWTLVLSIHGFMASRNPKVELKGKPVVSQGEEATIQWELEGNLERINFLRLSLVAKLQFGTEGSDRDLIYDQELLFSTQPEEIENGEVRVVIPKGQMHSVVKNTGLTVEWNIRVHGDVSFWPDVYEDYPIVVLPEGMPS